MVKAKKVTIDDKVASKLPKIQVRDDDSCCGLKQYYGFAKYFSMGMNLGSEKLRKEHCDFLIDKAMYSFRGLAGAATLTRDQTAIWGKSLEEKGWKIADSFTNRNSGNIVNLYYYTP